MSARTGRRHFCEAQAPAPRSTDGSGQDSLQRFPDADAPDFGGRTGYRGTGHLSSRVLFAGKRKAGDEAAAVDRARRQRIGRSIGETTGVVVRNHSGACKSASLFFGPKYHEIIRVDDSAKGNVWRPAGRRGLEIDLR